ncbi:MAG TPA: Gfo/Idh/MocA family oxidoreductase [Acidimicrobiales bacterium]|nr:Gfo/Idh/MocA family oxidoreductase [Acidimicrobiales bacterium]
MADNLRVGLIGVGWGALVHAPAFAAVDGYDLVALCSSRPESVAAGGERLGIGDTTTDWESFVRRDDLDLVSVSAPVERHHDMFLAALAAGRHVLCEKPLSLNGAQGRVMADAAEASDRATLACFENRWSPEHLAIRELVEGGAIGRPSFVQVTITTGYWHPTHKPQAAWMYRRDQGGGYLFGQMSHEIDFVQSLFGRAVAVCADVRHSIDRVTTPQGEVEVTADDTSGVLLRLESGALAVLSNSSAGLGAGTNLFEAHGSEGTIAVNRSPGSSGSLVARVGAEPVPLVPSTRRLASGVELPARRSSFAVQAMGLMLEDWLPAFGGEPTPTPTIRDGCAVQEVIDGAIASSEGAGWVELATTGGSGTWR